MTLTLTSAHEVRRLALQAALDAGKTPAQRNRLGQFATPTALARDVLRYGLALLPPSSAIRFVDPAIGTGSFYSALRDLSATVQSARGFEIDPHYGLPATELWRDTALELTLSDFTRCDAPLADAEKANLLICNPPYVRHHHLEGAEKLRLQAHVKATLGLDLSGLAGLYCYFFALVHAWMAEGGVAGWLVPSEFMDVNYGREVKDYLLSHVTLLHVHRFDPQEGQFDDALVSSAVVWIKNEKPPLEHRVKFSFGGTLIAPKTVRDVSAHDLRNTPKWTRFPMHDVATDYDGYVLGDLFAVKRGLVTGDNSFFILDEARAQALDLPTQFLRPVLPSSRYIKEDEVFADARGFPLLTKRLLLIDCALPELEIRRAWPSLWAYFETGAHTVASAYLCSARKHWYMQERREVAPIVCTYMGRGGRDVRPFRFLLNHSKAVATNVYLMMYPTSLLASRLALHPGAIRALWDALNAIDPLVLLGNGRVYGGGLYKLEPSELSKVRVDELAVLLDLPPKRVPVQLNFLEEFAV